MALTGLVNDYQTGRPVDVRVCAVEWSSVVLKLVRQVLLRCHQVAGDGRMKTMSVPDGTTMVGKSRNRSLS
jgi:hypothetical protein